MAHKAEIAHLSALTEGLGTNEVYVVKVPIIDYVAVAEHGAKALQEPPLSKLILVQTLQAFEMENMGGVLVQMPGIFPALAGAMLEAERNDFLHQRHKERQFGHALETLRCKRCPHVRRNEFKGFIGRFAAPLQRLINGNGGQDIAQMAVVAFVFIVCLLGDEPNHPGKDISLHLRRKFLVQNGISAIHNHVQGLVFFLHKLTRTGE